MERKKMEKYIQKHRDHENDRRERITRTEGSPELPKFQALSFQPLPMTNPSPCVDLQNTCFLIKEEKREGRAYLGRAPGRSSRARMSHQKA